MDALEIDDDVYVKEKLSMTGLITAADLQRKKSSCTTVCLAALCVVLLAGNVGQIIYYEFISHYVSPSDYQPQTQEKDPVHNHSTAAEACDSDRKRLEASLSNVTEEQLELQQRFQALATERDQAEARLKNMSSKREQVGATYSSLKQESERLQETLQELQTQHGSLAAARQQLHTKYTNLQRDNQALQTSFRSLTADRDQIQSNYSSLKAEKEQLQRHCNVVGASRAQLQRSYDSLWKDKDQLEAKHNLLLREKLWLQSNYSSLVTGHQHLQGRLHKLTAKLKGRRCQTGWTKFQISCYFVSTASKTWAEGRKACEAAGADLVVIDDKDEQEYVNGLLNSGQNAWIGLTDSLTEGTWRWVDGSPVTTAFWQPGQPNSYNGNQDCGEVVQKSGSGSRGEWNDDGCFAEQSWICEQ